MYAFLCFVSYVAHDSGSVSPDQEQREEALSGLALALFVFKSLIRIGLILALMDGCLETPVVVQESVPEFDI